MKRTPLNRKTRLKSGKPLKRTTKLKAKGKRRFKASEEQPYLAYIRSQPCLLAGRSWFGRNGGEHVHRCNSPSDPHHVKTKGAGGHDRDTVPLCRAAHTEVHTIGTQSFATRYGLDWTAELAGYQARYLRF